MEKMGFGILFVFFLSTMAHLMGFSKDVAVSKTMEEAIHKAQEYVSGDITEAELEKEGDRWIYSIELESRQVTEVEIDAETGFLVKISPDND